MSSLLRLLRLLVLLATFALLSPAATSSSSSCDKDQLVAVSLQPLRSNANYATCQVDASAAAICASPACKSLMASVAALALPTCQLGLKGVSFNTLALKSMIASSCQQSTRQNQEGPSDADMLWTLLRLLKDTR
ncbi:hypothetical protein PHYPSEUDO_012965 [Phytophthora pseudosyringae]|uniref:Elicitin n=1 Tax=Phytophthora pseudosyringae TaxID=221518 RepID=A0A8T1W7N4_9STRA|nr:hypothetical protein PHYPSEUDO_012965 [Phytophthora pseudosyringae]